MNIIQAISEAFSRLEGWNGGVEDITGNEHSDTGASKFHLSARTSGYIYLRYKPRQFVLLHNIRENKIHAGDT
jgi:hypothetical protein